MIVVRACHRPGAGPDGWGLLRETLRQVDAEGGYFSTRVVVCDQDAPPDLPENWRVQIHKGPRGARLVMWAALQAVRGSTRPVLFLEDDLILARHATDIMLAGNLDGVPLVSFFYPTWAFAWETNKKRLPSEDLWALHSFGFAQAFLLDPVALNRVIDAGFFPPLARPVGSPHGGDYALRDALFKAGYRTCRVVWPNLVEHAGLGALSACNPDASRKFQSGWFAGRPDVGR